jgi:hypothetical protein
MRRFLLAATGALLLASTAAPSIAQTSTSSSTTTTTTRTDTYVGSPITNSSGQVVGTITERRDNSYVVKGDQWLGVGERTYVFPQDKVVIGTGDKVTITTPLTREQILVLPSP